MGRSARPSRSTRAAVGAGPVARCSRSRTATKSYWALAHPPGDAAISTTPIASPRGLPRQRPMTLFGIDRLLAEPELRRPLEGKRVALLAHPASVTARPHPQPRRSRRRRRQTHRRLRAAARAARRQAGQYGRVRGFHRPGPRHPGVQPLRRGAPPDRPVDGHVRRDPDRPPGPRLPNLHLHHDAAVRARSRRRARQVGVGARPAQPRRPADRGADAARRLGKLRRRRADPDAPRADAGRARPLVRRPLQARRRLPGDRDARLGARRRRPASAGPRTASGSTPAPMPPTSTWRAAMPAR